MITVEVKNAAHFAHTLSRLALDYERMSQEYPWRRTRYLEDAARCRGEAWQWLDHARDIKERYQ